MAGSNNCRELACRHIGVLLGWVKTHTHTQAPLHQPGALNCVLLAGPGCPFCVAWVAVGSHWRFGAVAAVVALHCRVPPRAAGVSILTCSWAAWALHDHLPLWLGDLLALPDLALPALGAVCPPAPAVL